MKVGQVNSLVLESLENKSRICKTQKYVVAFVALFE